MKAVLPFLSLGIFLFVWTPPAAAQDAAPPKQQAEPASVIKPAPDDVTDSGPSLGEPFESLGLGIALRRPAGSKVIRQIGGTEVDFVNEKNKWNLRVARLTLSQKMPLETTKDAEGVKTVGLLEVTVDRLKDELPGATLLRQDVVKIGEVSVGMIALRYVKGLETLLSQQAIIRGGDQLYFTLTLTSPGNKDAARAQVDDPAEARAVALFGEVLDTIRLLDQRPLLRDQKDRFYEALALLVNTSGKGRLQAKLVPQQWLRVLRKGKDIGYVYTVEEMANGIPGDTSGSLRRKKAPGRGDSPEGVLIGTRSRTLAGEGSRIDAESWMFCTIDRRNEEWSTLQSVQNLKDGSKFDYTTTVGTSSRRTGRRLDREASKQGVRGVDDDPNQPPVYETTDYMLNVTHSGKSENYDPLSQSLPDYYAPQALSHLLPRLLPLDQPRKYVFAVYVPDVRKVMHRYLDVNEEKRVKFNGETVRAVTIGDRVGLEGSVTTHYFTADGRYIGSENPDTGVMVLPSDEKNLLELWKDADLTRPADVKPTDKPLAAGAAATVAPAAQSGQPAPGPAQRPRPNLPEKPIRQRGGASR